MTEQGGWAPDPGQQPQQTSQTGWQQPGYPAYQGYPGGWSGSTQPGPPTRPDTIARAVRVMYGAAALSVVGGVIGALVSINNDPSTGPFSQSNDLSQSDRDLIHTAGVIGGVIGVLIVLGLWLWMAWANGQGKLWARTTATVFAVISAVFWLFSLLGLVVLDLDTGSTARRAVSLGLSTVGQGLNAWIMYLLYRPESTAYYEAVTHPTPTYPYAYAYGYGHPYAYGNQPYAYGGSQPYAYGSGQPYPQGQANPQGQAYPYPYPYPYAGQPPQAPPDDEAPPPPGQSQPPPPS